MQNFPVLHIVIRLCSCDHAHSDHERQLAKIMAEVGCSTSSPGVSLHEWLDEDSKESLEEQNENTIKKTETICEGTYCVETLVICKCHA